MWCPERAGETTIFIQKVLTRRVGDRRYYTHRLLEWQTGDDGKSRKRVLLNLGANYPIPKAQWRLLCTILQDLMVPPMQPRLGGLDPPDLVREAHHLARRIRRRSSN